MNALGTCLLPWTAAILTTIAPTAGKAQGVEAPHSGVRVAASQSLTYESTKLGMPIDAALVSDGDLVVADFQSGRMTRLNSRGSVVWTVGGKGDGPGEFNFLYRVAAGPDDHLYAYDLGGSRISEFSVDGEYLRRIQLGLSFRQLDGFLVLETGDFVVAGIPAARGEPVRFALHLFSPDGEHKSSFGPLPATDSTEVLNYWGAGEIAEERNGDILFGRRIPYDFRRFTRDGEPLGKMSPGIPVSGTPDQAFVIERSGGRFSIRNSDVHVDRPLPPRVVWGGNILTGRITATGRTWDLLRPDGSLVRSMGVEDSWGGILAVDTTASVVWMVGNPGLTNDILRVELEGPIK